MFDYCFEGIVSKVESVSQYNGFGTNIPYTFYRVRVINEIKGNVDNEVIIKFYGGYNEQGELILIENTSLPEIGEIYTFYCNRTQLSFNDDQRTIDGSFVISHPDCMVKGRYQEETVENVKPVKKETKVLPKSLALKTYSLRYEIESSIIPTSSDFENATGIAIGYTYSFTMRNGEPYYFKIKRDTLDYLAIYSTGSSDVKVSVYDDYYVLLTRNDDVDPNSRGALYTSGLNFYCNFYADRNRYYYFRVAPYSSTQTASTTIRVIVDNYYTTNLNNLLSGKNAVKKSAIHFKDNSKWDYYVLIGAAEWNKLNSVQITVRTSQTSTEVNIYDYDDPDVWTVAYTTKHWLWGWKIYYNNAFFNQMTYSELLKSTMHEFGHTLGFNEFCTGSVCEAENNIMVQGIRELSKLGPADIYVYRHLWG